MRHIDDELAQGKKIGEKLEVDGEIVRLIGKEDKRVTSLLGKDIGGTGSTGSRKVRDIASRTLDKNKKLYKKLDEIETNKMLTVAEKSKKIQNKLASPSVEALNNFKSSIKKAIKEHKKKGLMPEEVFAGRYEAHHIVPKEMEIYFGKVFDELGLKLDEAFNGIMLPALNEFDEVVEAARNTLKESDIPINFWNRAKHQTHPDYNEMIKINLNRIFDGFENLSLADKAMVKQEFLGFIQQRKIWLESLTNDGTLKVLK